MPFTQSAQDSLDTSTNSLLYFDPSNVSLLNPLKTPKSLRFSNIFTGYRSETLIGNG